MKLKTLLMSVAAACLATASHAVLLTELVSQRSTGSITGVAAVPQVDGGRLSRGPGITVNTGNTYNSRGWTQGTDLQSAIDAGDFLLYRINVIDSVSIDLTSLSIGYDRSRSQGPRSMNISVSIDDGPYTSVFTDNSVNDGNNATTGIDLSSLDSAASHMVFRIACWNSGGSSGTFDLENQLTGSKAIRVFGDVNPIVIEPSGACCQDGVCADDVLVADCDGTPFTDMLCADVTCPSTGGDGPDFSLTACCIGNNCIDGSSVTNCGPSGGTFFQGVVCADLGDPNGTVLTCESFSGGTAVAGACCNGSVCADLVPADICVGDSVTFSVDGTCEDLDNNQVPDLCEAVEPICEGDANGDRAINVADFISVLLNFGSTGAGIEGDANSDETVNVADFIAVLLNFGMPCDA